MQNKQEAKGVYIFHPVKGKCRLNCIFCLKNDSSREEIKNAIKDEINALKEYSKKFVLKKIHLSGNDLLDFVNVPKLIEIIKKELQSSEITFSFETHGIGLTKEYLIKLVESGVRSFGFPLYAPKAELHDKIVGYNGAFNYIKGLLKTIKENENHFKSKGVNFRINSLILKQNQEYLPHLIYYLKDFTSEIISIMLALPSHDEVTLKYHPHFQDCYPDLSNLKDKLIDTIKLSKKYHLELILFNIPFCLFYDGTLKNIGYFRSNIAEIYSLKEANNLRQNRELNAFKLVLVNECKKCTFFSQCSGIYQVYVKNELFKPKPITLSNILTHLKIATFLNNPLFLANKKR
ncbi:MAG: 3,8-cyclase [Candidatus Woesearchaeota archaeon]|nr:3,8-cyclase [Candidatus Woesearchaeota archaeon]MDN5327863.1 3,8-cyclase [Candidatus Woesearchaeota archaeon]